MEANFDPVKTQAFKDLKHNLYENDKVEPSDIHNIVAKIQDQRDLFRKQKTGHFFFLYNLVSPVLCCKMNRRMTQDMKRVKEAERKY